MKRMRYNIYLYFNCNYKSYYKIIHICTWYNSREVKEKETLPHLKPNVGSEDFLRDVVLKGCISHLTRRIDHKL